ncbi:Transmembrane protein 63C [Perkinsus olseni]|uniref:Transmembrane protein 63C n=2 Tax=Perkinsus olseni TaxID=32597 RepID=A0A7J6MTM5_PEROL|nr:Transmembrane protein 63C [Perkinsus olseni]
MVKIYKSSLNVNNSAILAPSVEPLTSSFANHTSGVTPSTIPFFVSNSLDLSLSAQCERASTRKYTRIYYNIQTGQVIITFVFSIIGLVFFWALVEVLVRRKITNQLYMQRLKHPRCRGVDASNLDMRDLPPEPDNQKGHFKSILHAVRSLKNGSNDKRGDDERLLSIIGLDAFMVLRFLKMSLIFCIVSTAYVMLVLVPVYYSQPSSGETIGNGIAYINSSHINKNNVTHAWVSVISCYILTFFICGLMRYEWKHYARMRTVWLGQVRDSTRQARDEGAAGSLQSLTIRYGILKWVEAGACYFSAVFNSQRKMGKGVESLSWAGSLEGGREDIEKIEGKIERTRRRLRLMHEKGTLTRRRSAYSPVKRQDSVRQKFARHDSAALQSAIKAMDRAVGLIPSIIDDKDCTALVTFVDMRCRSAVSQLSLSQEPNYWHVREAPMPSDLIWENMTVSRHVTETRGKVVFALLVVWGLFYTVPIAAIQELASTLTLRNTEVDEDPALFSRDWWVQLVHLYLPTFLQLILLLALPQVFRFAAVYYERYKLRSEATMHVARRFFVFQMLTVYVIVLGELWLNIGDIWEKYSAADTTVCLLKAIGKDVPNVAVYFITVVCAKIVTNIGMATSHPYELCYLLVGYFRMDPQQRKYWIEDGRPIGEIDTSSPNRGQQKASTGTGLPPIYENKLTPPTRWDLAHVLYSEDVPNILFVLNICITFAVISPLVLVAGSIFFLFAWVAFTYQFAHMHTHAYETGGLIWKHHFMCICVSLALSHIVLVGVLIAKFNVHDRVVHAQLIAVLVLPFFVWFFYRNCVSTYTRCTEYVSLSVAAGLDGSDKSRSAIGHVDPVVAANFSPELYVHPLLQNRTPIYDIRGPIPQQVVEEQAPKQTPVAVTEPSPVVIESPMASSSSGEESDDTAAHYSDAESIADDDEHHEEISV